MISIKNMLLEGLCFLEDGIDDMPLPLLIDMLDGNEEDDFDEDDIDEDDIDENDIDEDDFDGFNLDDEF